MGLFDPPRSDDYPRKWKDMSVEFKLMFAYHGCMMLLFITGSRFTVGQEVFVAGILLLVLTAVSLRHRSAMGWQWQGVKTKQVATAIGIAVLMTLFLGTASPQFPASNPAFLPWYLAGFGIGLFNILQVLRLVRASEAQMLADSRTPSEEPRPAISGEPADEPAEPRWHRVVRAAYTCLFLLVWVGGVSSFYYQGTVFRSASASPTATQTDSLSEHGHVVYITRDQKTQLDSVETAVFLAIPVVLIGGFALHFLIGVKLFPNSPTLAEWRAGRSSRR